ncbi:MAG: hypothetical protein JWP45_2693 [Mucilaginibacter sp.]|nr:hypothetical protein [Mucilaginibacter sp.]
MKNLFFIILYLCVFSVSAQKTQKNDSIYYLIDTVKIPLLERVWHVPSDDSQYKNYVLQCPCLKFNGTPTFFYSSKDKGRVINKTELEAIKRISLSALIIKSKQLLDTQVISYLFYFIEPKGDEYIIHNVGLINPAIKIVPGADVTENKPDNSVFEKTGLIKIDSKDIVKYVNKSVITNGKIASTKVTEGNTMILLVGADYPKQDFTILIESANINKFDLPETFYTGKRVRVTGKVIEYKGKPAIIISDPNQIQWINPYKIKN